MKKCLRIVTILIIAIIIGISNFAVATSSINWSEQVTAEDLIDEYTANKEGLEEELKDLTSENLEKIITGFREAQGLTDEQKAVRDSMLSFMNSSSKHLTDTQKAKVGEFLTGTTQTIPDPGQTVDAAVQKTLDIIDPSSTDHSFAQVGSADNVIQYVMTMIYETEWKDIPEANRLQYLNFLNELASNPVLTDKKMETYLAAIQSRIATMKQTKLSDEEASVLSEIESKAREKQANIDEQYATDAGYAGQEVIHIYKEPSIDVEAEQEASYAREDDPVEDIIKGADNFIDEGTSAIKSEKMQEAFPDIYSILFQVGIAVAVIVAAVIAIKLIISGITEKAEQKKLLPIFLIGCIVVFGSFGIWKISVNIFEEISNAIDTTEEDPNSPDYTVPNRIRLNKTYLSLNMNRVTMYKLDAVLAAKKADLKTGQITWTSSDEGIATVNQKGLVTFKQEKEGTFKVTATYTVKNADGTTTELKAECTIKAVKTVMRSIHLTNVTNEGNKNKQPVLMLDKDHYKYSEISQKKDNPKDPTILLEVDPPEANIQFKSTNERVATVSRKGVITGKGYGTTTIKVTGSINGTSLTTELKLRVISRYTEASKDSGAFKNEKTRGETFYIRYYYNGRIDPKHYRI